jgi:hypothetical protein
MAPVRPLQTEFARGRMREAEIAVTSAPEVEIAAASAREAEIAAARAREAEIAAAVAREAEMAAAREREAEMSAARQREAEMLTEQVRAEQARAEQARAEQARTAQAEADSHPGATRLSGLRNVLFSLGINNLHKAKESEGQHDQPLPLRVAEVQPVVYHRTFVPYTESVAGAPSTVVTTAPEFLPPQAAPKGRQSDSDGAARRDRRDAYDEVEILPSWRGQYKRKD